jgi:ABC-type amino acid transport substrate-binding protein
MPALAATLERIKETGHIKLGYLVDARPFTYRNEAGTADGYSVALCQRIAEQIKTQLALTELTVDWVPVTMDSRLREVQQGNIDLLCTPTSVTLTRRQEAAFSIPVFGGGNRAVVHADALATFRAALAENPDTKPLWRGSPASRVLKGATLAVASGTTTQTWLQSERAKLQVDAKITPVADYRTGLQQVLDRKADVFFGDRTLILGAMDDAARKNLVILDRQFTHELAALALARGDEEFRLTVDRALSQLYASPDFRQLYETWCGLFDDNARTFFLWNTIAE